MRLLLRISLLLLAGMGCPAGYAAETDSTRIDLAHQVRDPAYGQILYHYYQQQYFAAMTRIVVALERNELPTQSDRARVLLGSLYASYGMPDEARALFESLMASTVSPELAVRIWMHLAEIEYRNGRYQAALDMLEAHVTEVPRGSRDHYHALRTRLLMKLGRYEETAAVLGNLDASTPLSGYLRYNLAVSRINAGQGEQGTQLLWQLVNLPPGNDEINALKDKSMLALGVHYLRTGQMEQARALMQSARLDGPYSELALLLHARAWLASDQPDRALPTLKALTSRSLQLQETQEALLALPFLYDRLGDYGRAQAAYRDGIRKFTDHFTYLNQLEQQIRSGEWFAQVAPEPAWSTAMDPVPPFEPARVDSFATFRQLFASDRFQHYWRAWHEQKRQVNLLVRWKQMLPALNELLAAHVRKYRQTVPVAEAMLAEVRALKMGEQLGDLQQRFEQARAANDMTQFASGRELVWLDAMDVAAGKVDRWQQKLDPALKERVDFYSRVLQWELRKTEVPRFWQREKQLAELAALTVTHEDNLARLERAAAGVDVGVYQKGQDLAQLNNELFRLTDRGEALSARIRGQLEQQALAEVASTRERLQYYIAESWAAMAELEHRAVNLRREFGAPAQPDGSRSEE